MPTPSHDTKLDELLAATAKVFADKGFHATTMRDLSRVSAMSLAGIYYYVRSKEELLYRIQARTFRRVLEGARKAAAGGGDPAGRLERFIRHHVTFFAEHMAEMKVLSHEAGSVAGEHLAAVNALKREYVALLTGLVADAADSMDPAQSRVAAYGLFGMMNWIYTWYDPGGAVSPEQLADHFAQLFLHGAVPFPVETRSDA